MFVFSSFILKKWLIRVKFPPREHYALRKKSLFLLWYKRKVFSFQLCVLLQHLVYPDRKALGYCICKSDTITQIYRPVSLDNICHFCLCISICIFCISSLVNFIQHFTWNRLCRSSNSSSEIPISSWSRFSDQPFKLCFFWLKLQNT